jgi:PhnB protein
MSETLTAEAPKTVVQGTLVPYLAVDGAVKAGKFYEQAFGATIESIHPPDEQGRTMHVHVYLNGVSIMLSDFYPEQGHPKVEPAGFSLMLMVGDDIHARFQRAADAGCTVLMPVEKQFWGDTYGQLKDPYGITWAMNHPG